jgi:hypothetical protein
MAYGTRRFCSLVSVELCGEASWFGWRRNEVRSLEEPAIMTYNEEQAGFEHDLQLIRR